MRLQDPFHLPALWPGVVADFQVSAVVRHPRTAFGRNVQSGHPFLLLDAGGALLWSAAYVGCGGLFRRQLGGVAATLSRFGAAIGYALGAVVAGYLTFKFVRFWKYHRAYRTHRMTPGELKRRMEAGEPL